MAKTEMAVREMQEPMVQGLAEVIAGYLERQLEAPKQQITNLVGRVDTIEKRMEVSGLSRSQGRAVQRAVGKKVHEIAKALGDARPQHFANVYGGIKDRYNVPSYLEIPQNKFIEAMQIIAAYDGSSRDWWRD